MLSSVEVAALVREAQAGDTRAFSRLAEHFARAAYAVALAHLGRPADAEDVAQDALLAALSRIDACREPDRFGAWLVQIARNRARNARDRRRHADVPRDEPGELAQPATEPDQERAVTRRSLTAALGALSPVQREVVLLHDLDGWSHAEIARALAVTEEASRQHLSRARRALRDRLRSILEPEARDD